ncbi:MAG: helix-turn-helix domain-containing protein [Aquabacterium sp.]|uniref:helix-turn-helix domain-containing protein n=1 Tax=Aquabacterium sp. TaxID=1872578 RepID=UPI0025C55215|nr:AraC family transcriptional regulator [Aquabacterium sp.]MBI5927601.1 helix-turn-helix domain-containing protein [Aquabacterium sp.]
MLDMTRFTPTSSPARPLRATGNDVIPFVAANAWIKAAMHCRFNIDPLFSAAGVDLNASNITMVRKSALLKLMQQCVDLAAPTNHFPLVIGEHFAFDHLPALETFLATSPTLRHALPALQWASMTMPNMSLRVEEHGATSALILDVDIPDPEVSATLRGYFVEAIFAAISKIVRLALGPNTLIHHIEMRHQPNARFFELTAGFPAPIRTGQARDAAVFATRMLDTPLPGASPGLHQRAQELVRQQLPTAEEKLDKQLERAFRQQPALLGQGLERMADRLGLHPRTLQRRLREENQQFTDIQTNCRLDMARAGLKAPQCDIESLSAQLGFADRHSFTRAFKRWTGLSPSAWRRQQLQQTPNGSHQP